ncbi:ABC transporter ATP-binding protein [Belnapia rosea]|uniref:Iron(III) transport system ATP-binding protein n=1 Tax=Belnapia rosea TaxID=938405 RepID=A0A1G6YI76_9PROT|nr:ATP-binding cassette domain-containing protein [Belnapia rosea]SDD90089.1 iron(III) transport system ATP-binding protein [Belnapia rosea]
MSAALERPPALVAAAPYLVVEQVSKRFGTFQALDHVSLAVEPGEFVSFLGPSGCGKTTLLRAIAGLDPPSSGRIAQGGRDITHLPPGRRDFGIVFQSYALFPNLSVTANIGYGLRGRAWPRRRREERVAELLALVGLAEHAAKYPAQLSGGQQQRVALARALASEPGLLLLDEPLSALDAIVRQHLRGEIRALQRRLGVTTVMVTHDQEEAMSVSDRVVVMSRGRIEQVGTPEAIYRQPASAFVAGFVGRSSHVSATVEAPPGLLLVEGLRLPCAAARPLLYGTPVEAFIRPEDVRLGGAATALPGAFDAEVTHGEFLGPVCRLSLEASLPSGRRWRLEADAPPELARAAPGTVLPVAFPAERVMVFPADA